MAEFQGATRESNTSNTNRTLNINPYPDGLADLNLNPPAITALLIATTGVLVFFARVETESEWGVPRVWEYFLPVSRKINGSNVEELLSRRINTPDTICGQSGSVGNGSVENEMHNAMGDQLGCRNGAVRVKGWMPAST